MSVNVALSSLETHYHAAMNCSRDLPAEAEPLRSYLIAIIRDAVNALEALEDAYG